MKESHPVETAEFARAQDIADEPAFAWWVPYTLQNRDVILAKLKARMHKTTHKYSIGLPTNIEHAMRLDRENKNSFWQDALALKMTNVGVAFEVLEENQHAPPGWKKIRTVYYLLDITLLYLLLLGIALHRLQGCVRRQCIIRMYTHADPQFIYYLLISLILFYFIASTSFIVLVIFVVGGIELSFFLPQVGPVLSGLISWSLAVRGCRP
jgi:hypothetical protein